MKLIKFSLEACRKNVGMNLKDASEYVGINYQTLSKYEHDSSHLDTNRYNIDTQKLDFSTANFSPAEIQKQNQDLVNHANDFLTDEDSGVIIPLDDEELKFLITKALRRYFNALRSNEKHIKNVENYLYGTMQNLFGVWWNKQAAREYAAKHPEEEKSADNDNSGLY
ncbi:replication initiator protein A (plasmid) [Levilactobacillus brevis]|nr:helix-turn-helix domain-containing protein [Levilactobacillus brevis]QCZ47248.1 replication initiator protein A [Levilactobacillus brevis]